MFVPKINDSFPFKKKIELVALHLLIIAGLNIRNLGLLIFKYSLIGALHRQNCRIFHKFAL